MPGSQRLPPWPDLAPLQPVLDAANIVGLFEWDIAAGRIYPCLGMVRIFGLDTAAIREGAPPSAFLAALHPDDRAAFAERAGRAQGAFGQIVYRVAGRPGLARPILECLRLTSGPDGEPDWACGALFDYLGARRPADLFRTVKLLDSLDRAAALAIELRRTVEEIESPTLKTLLDMVLIELAEALSRQVVEGPGAKRLN